MGMRLLFVVAAVLVAVCVALPDTAQRKKHGRGTTLPPASYTLLVPSVTTRELPTGYTTDADADARQILFTFTYNVADTVRFAPANIGDTDCTALTAASVAAHGSVARVSPTSLYYQYLQASAGADRELADPTPLCFTTDNGATWTPTGFLWKVVWSCTSDGNAETQCGQWGTRFDTDAGYTAARLALSPTARNQLAARTKCCEGNAVYNANGNDVQVSQCIDESIQTCCGSTSISLVNEICCNSGATGHEQVQTTSSPYDPIANACPCTNTVGCPTGESCCLARKFTELPVTTVNPEGLCYNPAHTRCCDTGSIYNPGTDQCCSVTGVQTLTLACPCTADSHCQGGQVDATGAATQLTGQICCVQTAPAVSFGSACTTYANYPTGTNANPAVPPTQCNGRCIDPRYQLCCNGAVCKQEFEKCCNATCCNSFSETCTEGIRPPANGGGVTVGNDFLVKYDACTSIEHLDTIRAFWVFVLPTVLLLGSLASTAVVLVFANKGAGRGFSIVERALITIGVIAILLAVPTFFSPVFKYGVVVILIQLLTIVTASARVKWLNVVAIVLQALLLLYLVDPFHGNAYLNFSSGRTTTGLPDPATAGIMQTTSNRLWDLRLDEHWRFLALAQENYCTAWYNGYFAVDPALVDFVRYDNTEIRTFGYCSRGWITALLIFEGFLLILVLSQLVLTIVGLLLRFKKAEPLPVSYVTAPVAAPVETYSYVTPATEQIPLAAPSASYLAR